MPLVTDVYGMFRLCENLVTPPNIINAENVIGLSSYLFDNCKAMTTSPTTLKLGGTDLRNLFYNCNALTNIADIQLTHNPILVDGMFRNCYVLNSIPTNIDFSSVTSAENLFAACKVITEIPSNTNLSLAGVNGGMFDGCLELQSIPNTVILPVWNNSARFTFRGCSKLTSIDADVTFGNNITNVSYFFANCYELTSVNFTQSVFDFTNVSSMIYFMSQCKKLTNFPTEILLSTPISLYAAFNKCYEMITAPIIDYSSVTDMFNLFASCNKLTSLNVTQFNCSPTRIEGLFDACTQLNLDNVTFNMTDVNMNSSSRWAFRNLDSTTILKGTIEILAVSNAYNVISSCDNLVEVENIKLTGSGAMYNFFDSNPLLECIGGYIDTTQASNRSNMFSGCTSLLNPDATEQAALTGIGGSTYTHTCV